MPPAFELHCFGAPRLLTADGQPVRLRTKKHLALLVRLALEPGRLFTRDLLVEFFWSSAPLRKARHSLVQGISVLRAKLGREHLVTTLTHVGLKAGIAGVDALQLDRGEADIRGAFLEGLNIADALEFERWKDEWQARLLPKIRDCLVKQMASARRLGEFRLVEDRAQTLFEFDPLSEDAVRGLVEARAEAGDRGNAIRLFQQFEERLAAELQAKPSPELVRFVGQLRASQGAGRVAAVREGGSPPATSVADHRGATRFVGRTQEYAALFDSWQRAKATKPAWVTVLGDPGLGKTSLVNRMAQAVSADGGLPLRTQAYESERFVPYAVFSDIARQLAACPAVAGTDPMWLGELARICPEIREMYPGVPPCVDLPAEVVPFRLAEAFVRTLAEVSTELPVMLAVDDLHLADESSVGLLHVILRKLTTQRLLAVVAIRTTELAASAQAAALLRDAAAEGGAQVELRPLEESDVQQIIAGVFEDHGVPVSVPAARRIQRKASGNPLAAELLTVDWIQNNDESLAVTADEVAAPLAGPEKIPQAIREALYRQLERLDVKTRGALDLASILGRRIGELGFYGRIGLTVAETTAALETLMRSYLLRETADAMEFRNELLRLQVYYAIPAQARKQLHSIAADQLLAAYPLPVGQLAAEVAWQLWRADRIAEALPHAVEGARHTMMQGAPAQAERTLGAVRERNLSTHQRLEVTLLLSEANLMQGKSQAALLLGRECLTSTELTPDEVADATRLVAGAMHHGQLGGHQELLQAAHAAVDAARRSGNLERLCRALQIAAFSVDAKVDESGMAALLREVTEITEGSGQHLGIAWTLRAFCEEWFDDVASASPSLRRAIPLLEGSGRTADLAFAYNGLGVCATSNCDVDEADAAFQASVRLTSDLGDDSRVARILSNLCHLRLKQGRFNEAQSIGQEAVKASQRALFDPVGYSSLCNLACAHWVVHDFENARELLLRAERWAAQQADPALRAVVEAEWADFYLATGSAEQALAKINTLEQSPVGPGRADLYRTTQMRLFAFRTAFHKGPKEAFQIVDRAVHHFRGKHAMGFLEALVVQSWLSRLGSGIPRPTPEPTPELFRSCGVSGLYTTLQVMGFTSPRHQAAPSNERSRPAWGRRAPAPTPSAPDSNGRKT